MQSWWAEETFKHILLTPNRVFVTLFSLNELNQKQQVKIGGAEHWICPELCDSHTRTQMWGILLECAINSQRLQTRSLMCRPTVGLVETERAAQLTRICETRPALLMQEQRHTSDHTFISCQSLQQSLKHVPYLTSNTYSTKAQRIRDLHECI